MPQGDHVFLIGIPIDVDLQRVYGMEVKVQANKVMFSLNQWRVEVNRPGFELKQGWVHVSRVPYQLCHVLGIWVLGFMNGTASDVDLLSLWHQGNVRILVGMQSARYHLKRLMAGEMHMQLLTW
jgi:hypothetical protein